VKTRAYFEMKDDVSIKSRWHLSVFYDSAKRKLDASAFACGRSVEMGPPLKLSLWDDEKLFL
jgi:hypothetical protein